MGMFNIKDFIHDNTKGVISVVDFGEDNLTYCHNDVKVKHKLEDIRDYKIEINESDMECAIFTTWENLKFMEDILKYFRKVLLIFTDMLLSNTLNDLGFKPIYYLPEDKLLFAKWEK